MCKIRPFCILMADEITQAFFCFFWFICISRTTNGPQRARLSIPYTATLPSYLWSLRIFPSLPGSRLRVFVAMQIEHSYTSLTNGGLLLTLAFSRFPFHSFPLSESSCLRIEFTNPYYSAIILNSETVRLSATPLEQPNESAVIL